MKKLFSKEVAFKIIARKKYGKWRLLLLMWKVNTCVVKKKKLYHSIIKVIHLLYVTIYNTYLILNLQGLIIFAYMLGGLIIIYNLKKI